MSRHERFLNYGKPRNELANWVEHKKVGRMVCTGVPLPGEPEIERVASDQDAGADQDLCPKHDENEGRSKREQRTQPETLCELQR